MAAVDRVMMTREFIAANYCEHCGAPKASEHNQIAVQPREMMHRGETVRLSMRETEIVKVLAKHLGQAVTKERLFNAVWGGGSDVDDKNLDVHVCRLRKKLPAGLRLDTVWGVGYRLVAVA